MDEATRFLRALYRGFLLREPDEQGLRHWRSALEHLSPTEIVELFITSEEFRCRVEVPAFVPNGHYYSPIVDVNEAEDHFRRFPTALVEHVPGIKIDRSQVVQTWHKLLPFMKETPFTNASDTGFRYRFDNPAYSWADGLVLSGMIRLFRPRRFIEVGSGWSSACTIDTVEAYLPGACDLTFIEPHLHVFEQVIVPAPSKAKIEILNCKVQEVPVGKFESLRVGDILFIDSSHVLRTGSDVCYELFNILPNLASGVLVHFHDIFWPFEYPRQWVIEERRSWNELYAVRAFLTNNAEWKIIMFNDYMAKLEASLIEHTNPLFLRNSGGALWLQKQ